MSGFRGMDYDERIKPFAQQVALLDAQRMEQIRSLRQQLEGAVTLLDEIAAVVKPSKTGKDWERMAALGDIRRILAKRGQ
jgi:hypothetical protein